MFYLSVFDLETLRRHNTFSKMDDFATAFVRARVGAHRCCRRCWKSKGKHLYKETLSGM